MGEKSIKIAKTAVVALFLFLSAFVLLGTLNVSAADATQPEAPTGLAAESGINQVSLSWVVPASDGGAAIDYYVIYKDGIELPDHPTGLATTVAIQYVYVNPMNWDPYVWTVAAHNAIGTGPQSLPDDAYPINTPGQIGFFDATPGDGVAYIECYNPGGRSDTGGLPILYNIVYQDGIDVMHSLDNQITIPGLTNGRTYSFSVAMHNAAGDGLKSTPMSVTPLGIPDAPTRLSATPLNQAVNVTWSAPAYTGGALDYYEIYLGTDLTVNPVAHTSQTYAVIGQLINGQTYDFVVVACNSRGHGASAQLSAAPRADPPGAPIGLISTPGNGKVDLSWTAPANNGGASIDYYVVYQDDIDVQHFTVNSGTINGLLNGKSYSFAVAAHNSAGIGANSTSISETPCTVANAPTGLMAIAGNGQATLNWTAPEVNGGGAIDYYVVYQDGGALPYQLTGPMTTIPGLVNGKAYTFTVAAHNPAGVGAQSVSAGATPITVPDAPTGLTAVPGNLQISINWTAPLSNGGSAIDYYIIYLNGVDVNHSTDTSYISRGLSYGQSYDYTVSAHNLAGVGAKAATVTATPRPALTFPGIPSDLTATPGDGRVDLAWSPVGDNGGSAIDYYVVYQNDIDVLHVGGNTVSVTGLPNGQSISFAVASHNVIGTSAKSAAVQTTPYTLPGVPTGLTATAGNGFAALAWTAPGSNGGAAIDHYVLYRDGTALPDDPIGLTCMIAGLTNGQSYNFTLAAHNPAGAGPSTYVIVTPTQTVPSEPLNATASTIDSGIVLNWSVPGDNGGYPITYNVYKGMVAGSESLLDNTASNSYTDMAITLGADYYYVIRAVNQLGSSAPSRQIGPVSASTAITLDLETESSSTIGAAMTVSGNVKTTIGETPVAGLSIDLAYSINNGLVWIDMPSVNTTPSGNFSSQWIPTATGIYMLRGTWAGNAVYQASTSMKSLAITSSLDKYVLTVQSNSAITDLSFNSGSKKLTFNVSGDPGTEGYSRIVVSKELVANGTEMKVFLDGNSMEYQLSSTNSSWILYFQYHHSTHRIVASLGEIKTGLADLSDSPLPIVAMAGLGIVAALLVAGLVLFNRRRTR